MSRILDIDIQKRTVKRQLRLLGLRSKKGLAQHFLTDEEVLQSIISAAELSQDDIVIEVGPGLGTLTRELARCAGQVIAIELDSKLASILSESLAPFSNVKIINADVLQVDPAEIIPAGTAAPSKYKVVANLPYYITSPTLRHFLEASCRPHLMVVTVQKEVAETIAARPGEMSLLSVSVQFYGQPSIVRYVPAESFYPSPKVDSAVLRIEVYEHPRVPVEDARQFFDIVRAGFSSPRKQLHNTLAQGLEIPREDITSSLQDLGIEPKRRAETLSVEEWAKIYAAFTNLRSR